MARSPVGEQLEWLFDPVLHLATGAVHLVVKRLGIAFKVGDDEAWIGAFRQVFQFGNHLESVVIPAACAVVELGEAALFLTRSGLLFFGVAHLWGNQSLKHLVARDTHDVIHCILSDYDAFAVPIHEGFGLAFSYMLNLPADQMNASDRYAVRAVIRDAADLLLWMTEVAQRICIL